MKHESIYRIYPNVVRISDDIAYDENDNIVEYDEEAIVVDMQNQKYVYDRQKDYPSIQEQLDTLYHGGYDAWKQSITDVKEKYPKLIKKS